MGTHGNQGESGILSTPQGGDETPLSTQEEDGAAKPTSQVVVVIQWGWQPQRQPRAALSSPTGGGESSRLLRLPPRQWVVPSWRAALQGLKAHGESTAPCSERSEQLSLRWQAGPRLDSEGAEAERTSLLSFLLQLPPPPVPRCSILRWRGALRWARFRGLGATFPLLARLSDRCGDGFPAQAAARRAVPAGAHPGGWPFPSTARSARAITLARAAFTGGACAPAMPYLTGLLRVGPEAK